MNAMKYKLMGGIVGGGIGFLIGSIICDLYFPEFEEVNPATEGEEALTSDQSARKTAAYYSRRSKADPEAPVAKSLTNVQEQKPLFPYHNLKQVYTLGDSDLLDFDPGGNAIVQDEPTPEPDIYVIPKDEYGNMENFPPIELTYFAYDDALLDPSGQAIDDVKSVIGEDTLDLFGQESDDDDTVYIRNEVLCYDYQINRINAPMPKEKRVRQVIDEGVDSDAAEDALALAAHERRERRRLVPMREGKRVVPDNGKVKGDKKP